MPSEIGDVDIFIHWTTIQGEAQFKTLAEGEMVEYELGRGPKVSVSETVLLEKLSLNLFVRFRASKH